MEAELNDQLGSKEENSNEGNDPQSQEKPSTDELDLHQQIEALKSQVETLKEALAITGPSNNECDREEINRLNEKLKAASRRRAQAQSQLASSEASLQEKSQALEKAEAKLLELHSELEKVSFLSGKYQAELKEKSIMLDDTEKEMDRMRNDHRAAIEKIGSLEEIVARNKEIATDLITKYEEIKYAFEGKEKELEEVQVEHKIASKRSTNLIKELRSQLHKEKDSTERLSAELEMKMGEILNLQDVRISMEEKTHELEKKIYTLSQDLKDEKNRGGSSLSLPGLPLRLKKGGSFLSANGGRSKGIPTPLEQSSQPPAPAPMSPPTSDKDDVKFALARRLEVLLAENQTLKEKITFLEGSNQDYAEELHQLKKSKENGQRSREISL